MKNFKKVITIIMLLISLGLLASCGQSSDDSSQSAQDSNNQDANAQNQNGRNAWGNNSPDLYGEVKAISGSKVTLALIEIPQRKQMTDEERQKMRENMQNRQNGQNGNGDFNPQPNGQGGNGDNNPPPNNQGSNGDNSGTQNGQNNNGNKRNGNGRNGNGRNGQGFGGMAQRKYTGKTEDVEIPSTASITTFERGNNNFNEKKLKIDDIKVGTIIQIWYKKDNGDKKEIENVRVMPVPSARPSASASPASASQSN
ncbi:MAG: hypothetical protein Q8942_05025 [Bacillota bacterium]|nr:hypothetical protein [Bacillota bacterium]